MSMNPFKSEGIISSAAKKIFSKNDAKEISPDMTVDAYFIGCNYYVPICAQACACCWDVPIPDGYESMAKYVRKRTDIGHTSVIEHSNLIMLIRYSSHAVGRDVIRFLSWCNYLGTTIIDDSIDEAYLILHGSLRAYADVIKECSDNGNIIYCKMLSILYSYTDAAMFGDLIKDGLLNENDFHINIKKIDEDHILSESGTIYDCDKFTIIGLDDITKIQKNINEVVPELKGYIPLYDFIKMATVSVVFKGMSRTCTHQLVRHRNAITQESQRYVDYSDASFANPMTFKPEKYDKDHKYSINFGPSGRMEMTLEEIGNAEISLYNQIHNPSVTGGDYALLKEDARAILPSNVRCNKIYITFTYKNLLKFLNLREDKHAQAEIRSYAIALGDWFRQNNIYFDTKEMCDKYTKARVLIDSAYISVDENLGVEEEVVPTVDDYVKAAGLSADNENINNNSKEENNNGI